MENPTKGLSSTGNFMEKGFTYYPTKTNMKGSSRMERDTAGGELNTKMEICILGIGRMTNDVEMETQSEIMATIMWEISQMI